MVNSSSRRAIMVRMVKSSRRQPAVDVFELAVGDDQLVIISMPSRDAAASDELSPAECEVALDAAAGLSNKAIARRRKRSARTVANQLASVYRKLGVSSRAELTVKFLSGAR
jgi:DNA-binding NarL/FixJ family response regulator